MSERMTDAALAICSNGIPDAERMLKELRELCDRSINAGGERYILPNTDRYLLIWAMDAITTADAALRASPQAVAEVKQYHDVAQRLYELLDNIDTAGDIAKSDDKLYRGIVERTQAKKRDYIVSCDGYTVVLADDSMLAASQSATGGA